MHMSRSPSILYLFISSGVYSARLKMKEKKEIGMLTTIDTMQRKFAA